MKGYYTKNTTVHPYVTVREFLLAEAFPATTLPMGANECSTPGIKENINMSMTLKANEDNWPDGGRYETVNAIKGKSWWHSDYKDVPYQFTYPFYKKITEQIKK